jgi:hypothetical protein
MLEFFLIGLERSCGTGKINREMLQQAIQPQNGTFHAFAQQR